MIIKNKHSGYTKDGTRLLHKGETGGSTTTNSVDPRFNPLIDYATQTAGRVNSSGFTPYGGQRYEGMNDTQKTGIDMVTQRATGGDPTMNQAQETLQQTLKGGNTNPYLDSMVNKAQTGVMANMGALQARSGSFGNSGIAEQGAKQMGDIATQMYSGAYNTDQANKMAALNLAPQYGNQAYTDAAQLMKAGGQVQDQEQQNKDFQYSQFQEQQNLPYKQMAAYSGLLGTGANSKSTTTQQGGGK